jgi:hypothetical protein
LQPYKFQLVPVVHKVEGDRIVGERVLAGPEGQPVVVYGIEGLKQWADEFPALLAGMVETAAANGT